MLDKGAPLSRMVNGQIEGRPPVGVNGRDEDAILSINFAAVFWRRRWIILVCVILSLVTAFVSLRRAVPLFECDSLLYVHQSAPRIISDAVVSNEAANLFTQCELIKSTANLASALEMPGVAETKMLRGSENPVGLLKSLITAEPGKQGELVKISMTSTDPADAPVILNAVVQAYIDYQNKQQKSSASEVLKVLEKQKDRYESQLKDLSDNLVKFKQDNPEMAMATDKGNVITERFATLSDALTHAEFATLELQLQNDEIAAMKGDPVQLRQYISMVAGKEGVSQQNVAGESELNELISKERQIKRQTGPASPQVIELDQEITELQSQLAIQEKQSLDNFVSVAAFNLKQAKIYQQNLSLEVEKERNAAVNLNSKSARFDQMLSEKGRDERMLDTLDNRIKEMNVNEDAGGQGGITVSILETAKPNFSPISPKPTQTMALGLVGGIILGLGAALLQDFLDQRLRSSEEIGRLLELPVLGTIPHMTGKFTAAQRGQEVHLRTRSDVSEAYRTVRTAIYFGVAEDSGKTFLITSPAPGDGKSTMASNIAIAMAQAGRRVLLVDADCRRPSQHRIFSVESEVGLSTVLLGRTPFAEAVHRTSTENLDILPCGPLPSNPSELLDSQAFIDLLKSISASYDKIVIDSPPLVPVTDARIIAASCDVTILVLRAEKSTRRMTQHAVDALNSVGAYVLGVVVNDVPRGQNGSYYYSGYGAYRYGYSSNGATHNGNGASKEVKAITVTSKVIEP
jgi:capsular exopolysaccharide synthesis family protein